MSAARSRPRYSHLNQAEDKQAAGRPFGTLPIIEDRSHLRLAPVERIETPSRMETLTEGIG